MLGIEPRSPGIAPPPPRITLPSPGESPPPGITPPPPEIVPPPPGIEPPMPGISSRRSDSSIPSQNRQQEAPKVDYLRRNRHQAADHKDFKHHDLLRTPMVTPDVVDA